MKEEFLHYLWQYQLFDKQYLQTNSGETIYIERTGHHNINSGPDFLEAKIQIGKELWVGSVEIHLKASDWYVHNHESDPKYDNVILHVVWEDDIPVFRQNNAPVSAFEMKGLVPKYIWNNYRNLIQKSNKWIACENLIGQIDVLTWYGWLERLYVERLEKKAIDIEQLLVNSVNDWEAVLFKLMAKNFGLKVNGSAFLSLANTFDFSIVRKERSEKNNLEALLFGQAGLLEKKLDDSYYVALQEIYRYQQHKYKLEANPENVQFFRLRPTNFPTIRLSQLANLFSKNQNLFQKLMTSNDVSALYGLLQTKASSYWDFHFVFGKESKKSIKRSTKSFIDLLLINTIIPLRFAYQKHRGNPDIEDLFSILQQLKPEINSIVKKYEALGIRTKSAMDSQALLTLRNTYCKEQRCLKCAVGLQVLKSE